MKHGDIVRSVRGFMIGKVVNTETECAIYSLDDDNKWVIRASYLKQFKKDWKVIEAAQK